VDKLVHPFIDRAVEALATLGLMAFCVPRHAGDRGDSPDAELVIQHRGLEQRFPVQVRGRVTDADADPHANTGTDPAERPILVTDHVAPVLAERLRNAGVAFVDTAGNAYLNTARLYLYVQGRKRGARRARRPGPQDFETHRNVGVGRALEPAGLKLLFTLLLEPELLERPYREMAQRAGIAHGTVGWAMPDLERRGFVLAQPGTGKRRRRTMVQVEQLLPLWVEAFARALRPKLLMARYRATDPLRPLGKLQLLPDMQWGGEVAAAQLTDYPEPGTATLWADWVDPRFVLENGLIPDPAGPIEILQRFWNQDLNEGATTVPTLLVYADLIASRDARVREQAELVKGQIS
jgi:hypothetical protein